MSDSGSTRIVLGNIRLRENGSGTMIFARNGNGSTGDSLDCFCLKADINSNVQGVSNSIVVGNKIGMGDSGVSVSFEDIKLEGLKLGDDDRKITGYQVWNFWIGIVMATLLVAMVLLQIYY